MFHGLGEEAKEAGVEDDERQACAEGQISKISKITPGSRMKGSELVEVCAERSAACEHRMENN